MVLDTAPATPPARKAAVTGSETVVLIPYKREAFPGNGPWALLAGVISSFENHALCLPYLMGVVVTARFSTKRLCHRHPVVHAG